MLTAFAILLVVHGLIHVLGTAKAFSWADLPQLTQPISVTFGALWLLAALLFLTTAVSLFVWPRGWWAIGVCAVVVSMLVIVPAWTDAKFGALANAVVLAGVAFGFLSQGPFSLRAEYERDVEVTCVRPRARRHRCGPRSSPGSCAAIPPSRWCRRQARVHNFRVRMHGRIRNGRQDRWMPFTAEQYNVVDPAARLFYLDASMFTIPVQGYHRYVGSSASMRVKAAALVPVVDGDGLRDDAGRDGHVAQRHVHHGAGHADRPGHRPGRRSMGARPERALRTPATRSRPSCRSTRPAS